MKVQKCKGMRDLSPDEMKVFRMVEGTYRDCCSRWGYREVRTPTIEYLHLFTSAGTLTPGMLGRVYSFLDWDGWSGERVVLRPDGTIPVARYYNESLESKGLARLFYATNIFIFEETGEKSRERWQCGAELIGAGSSLADVELISLSLEVLEKLGLKNVTLRLSHAGLVKSLLVKLGLSSEEQNLMFDQIMDGNPEVLARAGKGHPELQSALLPLLGLKGQSTGFLRNLKATLAASLPEIGSQLDDFLPTVALLEALGCRYKIDIASGAGFEYYTGMIFQLYVGDEKIGGGGRYDALIPAMGGGEVPASGFALYLDRLAKMVKLVSAEEWAGAGILVKTPSDAAVIKEAFKLASALREAGYTVEFDLDGQKIGTRWIIEVGVKKLTFVLTLTDVEGKRRQETSNVEEIKQLLVREVGDKNSSA